MSQRYAKPTDAQRSQLHGPSDEAYIRKAGSPPIGRIAGRAADGTPRDAEDALELARSMPWWREGATVVGRDARYWVVGAVPPRNDVGKAIAARLVPLRRTG